MRDRQRSLTEPTRPAGPVFLAATLVTELAKATRLASLEKLCKPAIVPAALTLALRDGELAPVDTALLAATGAGYTAGDVILMLGDGHANRSTRRLVAGAAAFGVGHLALGAKILSAWNRFRPLLE